MPAYNEENTVSQAVAEILTTDYPCEIELIVVDDGSTDETQALLSRFHDDRLIVRRHPVNKGKGAALRSAASLATGTHLLPFDADLEYAAADIPRMLDPVLKGRCDVVYGARLFGYNTVYQSYRYAMGNRLLTSLANIFFNASLTDLHTCLKLVPATMMKEMSLHEIGFGLDTELTALMLLRGIRPFEVPISYYSRSHAEGKKITWRDAVKCVWILLRVRLRGRSRLHSARLADQSVVDQSSVPRGPAAGESEFSRNGLVPLTRRAAPGSARVSPRWDQPSGISPRWSAEKSTWRLE